MPIKSILKRRLGLVAFTMALEDEEFEDEFVWKYIQKRKKVLPMYNAREQEGTFHTLFQTYLSNDEKLFQRYLRLPPLMFYSLLEDIKLDVESAPTNRYRDPISPEQQLCLTLRLVQFDDFIFSTYSK